MTSKKNGLLHCFIVFLAACGGGGSPEDPVLPVLQPPPPPTGVAASPANAQATISWAAAPRATSYNVYSSPTSPVTTASNKTNVTALGTTVSSLANAAPIFVKVAAVNADGESALSSEVCAVPTAASTTGLTLYDPLCSGTLDGAKWRSAAFSRAVSNGAMALGVQMSNMESFASRGLLYVIPAIVNSGSQRVTTLKADVRLPAGTATRTGAAELSAGLGLQYQPPANRLGTDIGSALNSTRVLVGLIDSGNGLRVFRLLVHCDDAFCNALSSSGVAFTDPAGFDANGEAAAAYDTTYTFNVSVNEATNVVTWSVSGGTFGAGVSGTMNASAYLTGNPAWNALAPNPLGGGFQNAQLRTRLLDRSTTGGSGGAVTAEFDNAYVGLDNAAATLWDDFSGSNGNSGPLELSAAKWTPGRTSMAPAAGSLTQHLQMTSPSTLGLGYAQSLRVSDPASVNTIQADATVVSCANDAASGSTRISLEANLYNDGSVGTVAPNINQPNSQVGDVRAYLMLDCVAQTARFQIIRWNSTTPLLGTLLSNDANSAVPMGPAPIVGNTHTLAMKWDPAARTVTFQVDGQTPVVVNPTSVNTYITQAAPYVKPANAPFKAIAGYVVIPASVSAAGRTGSMDFRLNNVFTAP